MIAMKLNVVTTTGTVPVMISPKVQVEFERHYKLGIAKAFGDDLKMEHIYFLAWKAMAHVGKTTATFDVWLDDVVDVEMDSDDSAPLAPTP
jgi:hypothetical protein